FPARDHGERERQPIPGARAARREQPDEPGERQRNEGEREDPAERRIALQRPADRRVAEREPGKAGEHPGAQPLGERPGGGDEKARAGRIADGEPAGDKLVNRDSPYLSPLGLSTSSV